MDNPDQEALAAEVVPLPPLDVPLDVPVEALNDELADAPSPLAELCADELAEPLSLLLDELAVLDFLPPLDDVRLSVW